MSAPSQPQASKCECECTFCTEQRAKPACSTGASYDAHARWLDMAVFGEGLRANPDLARVYVVRFVQGDCATCRQMQRVVARADAAAAADAADSLLGLLGVWGLARRRALDGPDAEFREQRDKLEEHLRLRAEAHGQAGLSLRRP